MAAEFSIVLSGCWVLTGTFRRWTPKLPSPWAQWTLTTHWENEFSCAWTNPVGVSECLSCRWWWWHLCQSSPLERPGWSGGLCAEVGCFANTNLPELIRKQLFHPVGNWDILILRWDAETFKYLLKWNVLTQKLSKQEVFTGTRKSKSGHFEFSFQRSRVEGQR